MQEAVPPVPPSPSGGEAPRSTRSSLLLALGILSLICCQVLGPVTWYLASQELQQIQAGAVSRQDEGLVRASKILGIIGTILLGLSLIWIFLAGGLAFLGALAEQMGA
ncbi:MAG: hypothetical protein Kow00109_28650 [Acidobacteriota bacterium]